MKYRDLSQEELSGTLCNWTLHNVNDFIISSEELRCEVDRRQLIPILVTAEVINDSKGRWFPGETMRSTFLTAFDIHTMRVKTENSVYQLKGNGFVVMGMNRSIEECVGHAILALQIYEKGKLDIFTNASDVKEKQ